MSGQLIPPTLAEIRRAHEIIEQEIDLPTPLIHSPGLSEQLNAHVSIKLEAATPTSAFKVRGGIYLASQLDADARQRGLVTASTGNHGQSIAYGAAVADTSATIFMPTDANTDKIAAIERFGGRVELVGERVDECFLAAAEFAHERGALYVEPINQPTLIAGVETAALEVLESQQPDTDLVIIPLGGGTGASGWLTVRDGLQHPAEIWAAQSSLAPAVHDAWRSGKSEPRPNRTLAEGIATGVVFDLPLVILRAALNDFILVDDEQILAALRRLWDLQHIMSEPAGSVSLAAAEQERDRLRDRRVVLVISGANATRQQLRDWLRD